MAGNSSGPWGDKSDKNKRLRSKSKNTDYQTDAGEANNESSEIKEELNINSSAKEFDFNFGERSTRKAFVTAVAASIIFFFLYDSEVIFDLKWSSKEPLIAFIITSMFGGVTFIFGLILFRSGNFSVLLYYPTWFIIIKVYDGYNLDSYEVFGVFIGTALVAFIVLFIFGLALEWIKQGK